MALTISGRASEFNDTRLPASLTVVTNAEGLATKTFCIRWSDFLAGTGKVQKRSAAQIYKGSAERVEVDIDEAAALMDSLENDKAILCGVFEERRVKLTTQKSLNGSGARTLDDDGCSDFDDDDDGLPVAARDREHTSYPEGEPGWFPLDCDALPGQAALSQERADRIIREMMPEWGTAGRFWRPSASASIIVPEGIEPPSPGGLHAYAMVPDASRIPAIGEELFRRLWLAGYGTIVVGEAGQLLVRSIIDDLVWQPERLFFEAAPCLGNPKLRFRRIKRRKVESTIIRGTRYFDPAGIGTADRAKFEALVKAEKEKLKPVAAPKQKAFVEKAIKAAEARGKPVKKDTLWNAVQRFVLAADFPIELPDGSVITVGDMLADPDTWHGQRFGDPLEPGYGGDKRIAVAYLKQPKPCIYSHAHGGISYMLQSARRPNTARSGTNQPVVRMEGGALARNATECEYYLRQADVQIYRKNGRLVRPARNKLRDSKGNDVLVPAISDVAAVTIRDQISQHIETQKWAKTPTPGDWIKADPTKDIAETIIDRRGENDQFWRTLAGVSGTPFLRKDGSIADAYGFDDATGVFLMDPVALPASMPPHPTKADAERALADLEKLLPDFPFVDPRVKQPTEEEKKDEQAELAAMLRKAKADPSNKDEKEVEAAVTLAKRMKTASWSVGLSGLLTPIARQAIEVAPIHLARATAARTGKGYLWNIMAGIALGTKCPVTAAGKDEEELEKRLTARMLQGNPVINIDNANRTIGGDLLCQAATESIITPRILRKSVAPDITNRFTIFGTGNNISVEDDLTERTLMTSMDAKMENPGERKFKQRPFDTVLNNRGKYVAACLIS